MRLRRRLLLIAEAGLALAGCASRPSLDEAPSIVFVHGNGDSAALWQTTVWRFESNGWPRERLHAIDLPYPLTRPRGYFDLRRDKISFDGQPPAGVPPTGAGVSSSKIKLDKPDLCTIMAGFNGERISGQTRPVAGNHVVVLELTY